MTPLKLLSAATVTLMIAGCQTTAVRKHPRPIGPAVGQTRVVPTKVGDMAVTLRRADRAERRFTVRRADGRPARNGPGPRSIAVNAVQRAFPGGACARGRNPSIQSANFQPRRGAWAVQVRCR